MRRTLLLVALLLAAGSRAGAQGPSSCAYRDCALGVIPTLVSLDVVRGVEEERVARLGFFWAGDIRPAFAGSERAVALAGKAVRTRRAAAALTDAGLLVMGIAAAMVAREGSVERAGAGVAAGGVALLAASFPVQLLADAQLSRAVWWYNAELAR